MNRLNTFNRVKCIQFGNNLIYKKDIIDVMKIGLGNGDEPGIMISYLDRFGLDPNAIKTYTQSFDHHHTRDDFYAMCKYWITTE